MSTVNDYDDLPEHYRKFIDTLPEPETSKDDNRVWVLYSDFAAPTDMLCCKPIINPMQNLTKFWSVISNRHPGIFYNIGDEDSSVLVLKLPKNWYDFFELTFS